MGLLSLFKKKEGSILDTPPPLQTKPSPSFDLDLPPISSYQASSYQSSPYQTQANPKSQPSQSLQPSQPQQSSIQQQLASYPMPTFPDIPLDGELDVPPMAPSQFSFQSETELDAPPMPQTQPQLQPQLQPQAQSDPQMDLPPMSSPSFSTNIQSQTQPQILSDPQIHSPISEYEFNINDELFPNNLSQMQQSQQMQQIQQSQQMQQMQQQMQPQQQQQQFNFTKSNVYKDKEIENSFKAAQQQIQKKPQLQQLAINKPIFISLLQYKSVMNSVETTYNDITIASDTLFRFFQLYNDMESAYSQWQHTLDQLQEDMVDLDKALFKFS